MNRIYTYYIWTRVLTPREMCEFLDYVATLDPPYIIKDASEKSKRDEGGKLPIKMHESHKKEATYIKIMWG